MNKRKHWILVVLLLLILIGAGFLVYKALNKTPSKPVATLPAASPVLAQAAYVQMGDAKYQKPEGWVLLAKDALDTRGAVSGIGHPPGLTASFLIKVSAAVPQSNDELKSSTLLELNKNPHFTLVSSAAVKVDGNPGQQFIYTFGDSGKKTKQDLRVVIHKQKTFFLLSSSSETDFASYQADFTKIMSDLKLL